MKTKGHRIFGCLLMICAIGIAIGVCATAANSKIPLSDNAMGNVYGGCGPCDSMDVEGCAPGDDSCDVNEEEEDCDGYHKTSCKQTQKECKEQTPELCDDSMSKACFYVDFTRYKCKWTVGTCVDDPLYTTNCAGSKEWCLGEYPE